VPKFKMETDSCNGGCMKLIFFAVMSVIFCVCKPCVAQTNNHALSLIQRAKLEPRVGEKVQEICDLILASGWSDAIDQRVSSELRKYEGFKEFSSEKKRVSWINYDLLCGIDYLFTGNKSRVVEATLIHDTYPAFVSYLFEEAIKNNDLDVLKGGFWANYIIDMELSFSQKNTKQCFMLLDPSAREYDFDMNALVVLSRMNLINCQKEFLLRYPFMAGSRIDLLREAERRGLIKDDTRDVLGLLNLKETKYEYDFIKLPSGTQAFEWYKQHIIKNAGLDDEFNSYLDEMIQTLTEGSRINR